MSDLQSVNTKQKDDGSWQSTHVPSGKITHGMTAQESQDAMRELIGMQEDGKFTEPTTSQNFEGSAKDIALFLEGEVSEALKFHSGFARLMSLDDQIAEIKLGGGCSGCPSSALTLFNGVKTQLQEKFGESVVADVMLA
jgi:Fe-S cluster biogenesis protein NfuA